jgi:hypothetical protein
MISNQHPLLNLKQLIQKISRKNGICWQREICNTSLPRHDLGATVSEMPPKKIIRAGGGRPTPQTRILRGKSSAESFNEATSVASDLLADRHQPTKLHFIFQNNESLDIFLKNGPSTYWDLQQSISRHQPGKTRMFSILNENKEFVTSENFVPSSKFVIKEYYSHVPSQRHPLVPMKWDHTTYHGRPVGWKDPEEVKAEQARKEELRIQREKEEEERIAQEFLLKTSTTMTRIDH